VGVAATQTNRPTIEFWKENKTDRAEIFGRKKFGNRMQILVGKAEMRAT
jgi:hypothetical protein